MIVRNDLIERYIRFFESKGHKEVPSSTLVPENDSSVLFTTAGMQPLVPYLLGQKHPLGSRLVGIQRCVRTGDIDVIGDNTHLTFFEMLGNWSLGDYFKEEAIRWSYEFLTEELKIPLDRIAVSVFSGDGIIDRDNKSAEIWMSLGVSKDRIAFLGKDDNWWGPAGETGPCGPDTEMFFWKDNNSKSPKIFDPKDDNWVEIWNDVLMEYIKDESGNYAKAEQKNIDTGMGVERTLVSLNGLNSVYETELFLPIIKKLEKITSKNNLVNNISARIISDHLKASCFIIADGVIPSNTERGYVLRRLIRRAIRHGQLLGINNFSEEICKTIFEIYPNYSILQDKKDLIIKTIKDEEYKFSLTIEKGLKEFDKLSKNNIDGESAFLLYQSYGFPIEITLELAKEKNILVDVDGFNNELKKHQELSRTSSSGIFKSGLADNSEITTRLHTATHLLNEALRKILGDNVKQKGSNITPERLRFDFNFERKLTPEEIKDIENLVNEKIEMGLNVDRFEMSLAKAISSGAQAEFGTKYPDIVSVYSVGDFSREICTGPHVKNTSEIGKFKIIKEEISASGIRRIKAIVE